jgi:sugar O-acyltransferase (sialic acid O-acetyltransferase NeuD family)
LYNQQVKKEKDIVIIGYSGHSYVVLEIFRAMGRTVSHYCEPVEKEKNPYSLSYLGNENEDTVMRKLQSFDCFASIGNNSVRKDTLKRLVDLASINAIHPSSIISGTARLGKSIMIGAGAVINAQSVIGNGVICNTGSIVEHECTIGEHSHIAPGAVLCGNVTVGNGTFVGANAVIREGITIGNNVTIGAGTVVTKNIADDCRIVGNPQRSL